MEVIGTVMSVAQTLFAALENKEVREVLTICGYKSELEDLQRTVETIKAVFRDAERKQFNLSEVQKLLLEDLKDAVYEADDLLDEFVTLAEQKKLLKADGSFSKKMRNFVSCRNPLGVAYRMSKGVKKIKKKLNAIAYNKQFTLFDHGPEPIRNRRPETCSYVNQVDIIGRGQDLEEIVAMLLDPNNVHKDLCYLSIVGIGGMGKTALTQLVFNDPRVKTAFRLQSWVCVSDQDKKQLDVKEVLRKILAAAIDTSDNEKVLHTLQSDEKLDDNSTLDQIQRVLHKKKAGKRYLFVLDDVWTEKPEEWRGLAQYFVGGQRGSWILVTTRSKKTATIVGGKAGPMHQLEGLSEVDSRRLFARTAFGSEETNPPPDDELVELGKEIVDGCARVPLAIRVVGSLLYCQDKSKWKSMKEIGLSNIRKREDGINSILQLSYHHLESPLKSCFSYCALFPKDFVMEKQMLIDLWMAQGYVVSLYEGQSVEDVGEEYFSILLKRCFFQDIKKDENGEIVSCKMHDLMHDIAQSVSGKEIYAASASSSGCFSEKVRHFSIPYREYREHPLRETHVRSYIHVGGGARYTQVKLESCYVEDLISSCRGLRAFHLAGLLMKNLPDSTSKLLHLRYLDLSYNKDLELLPKSITKLYNLQNLKLESCWNLKELPKDLSKLVKLRVIDISWCNKLEYMPRGMDKLTCLNRLSDFIVGSEGSFVSWKRWFDGLEELKALKKLKGGLRVLIKWPKNAHNVVTEVNVRKGSILSSKEHLSSIFIKFEREERGGRMDEELMEDLHPHPNLKKLKVMFYQGSRMPDWASHHHLPNLVELELDDCEKLKDWRRGIDGAEDASRSSGNNSQPQPCCLPQLKSLWIRNCPELTWIPLCPKLEIFTLFQFNKRLVFGEVGSASASTSSCHKLKKIIIDNVAWLNSLPMEAFQCLERLQIGFDKEVEKLGEVMGEVFRSCSSSLRDLLIHSCGNLRSVVGGGGLEHLTALEYLHIWDCENLSLSEDEEEKEGGIMPMPCPSLLPSLRTLNLRGLSRLENLPKWMQFLPALQTLEINDCQKLKAMPKWMPILTSLRALIVMNCPRSLKRRCQKEPQGEDWPLIQHIPGIIFRCRVPEDE